MKDDPIYITGHRHPDTDSVVSAIAYAFFKRCGGQKAVPCRLGDLNSETKYLLDRFEYPEPILLTDGRKTLKEIDLDPPEYVTPATTIRETVRLMHETNRNSFAVCDESGLVGYVSKSDLANLGLGDTAAEIELLKHTAPSDMAAAIDGQLIYDDPRLHINGKVSIIAYSTKGASLYELQDRIVILGNDEEAQLDVIARGAGMLIMVWTSQLSETVIAAAKEHHCALIISGHGTMNTSRYLFLAPPVKLVMREKVVRFKGTEYCEDAGKKMLKSRFRSYPVVDADEHLIGYVSRFHILNHRNRRIVLVDHNEFSQSVRNIEKAQILEVIDHHRINDFMTSQPVSFRNEIVGSTATIIATMFIENQIPIPQKLAGLLLGAVLSDTLVFQSPTTTDKDRRIGNLLVALADLEIEDFAAEMFAASASDPDQSIHEMIVQDIKYYDINGMHTMVSQVIVTSAEKMKEREAEIMEDMESLVVKKDLDLLVVAFTSVMEDGTVFYTAGEKGPLIAEALKDEDHSLKKHVFSRKKQILPAISEALEDL